VREFYVRHGIPHDKFCVIPNAIRPPKPGTATREAVLAELGLPRDARLIGVVGRLWPQKRVKDAIWAADLLKVVRDDVHLLIIGDGPERDRLRKFRDQCEIGDKVHFLGHRDDVPRLLPHFDLLWSTSAYEGQSNAILEAMAVGVPVVATDIPGTRDLLAHDETGLLVSADCDTPRRRAALARYASILLNDPQRARRLADAARQRALDEFTVEKMVDRYADLYREILGG
jgi:glycosyltransferase involved in cell wall biosynthesis